MLAQVWNIARSALNAQGTWQRLTGRAKLDVVCITHLVDEAEREALLQPGQERHHLPGPLLHLAGLTAQTRVLNVTARDLLSAKGRQKARSMCFEAVTWAQAQGARVVQLASATQWLFGRDAAALKSRFPGMTFTSGDNGSALLLCQGVDRVIARAGLRRPRVLVLGPYTTLGSALSRHLMAQGFDVVGWGHTARLLEDHAANTGMATATSLTTAGPVDLVVACSQGAKPKLSAEELGALRRTGRKLLVLDATPGATVDAATLAACDGWLLRQDAGLASAPGLHLGSPSVQPHRRSRSTVFGAMAEALALCHAVREPNAAEPQARNWFEVNALNTTRVREALEDLGLRLAAPQDFDLSIRTGQQGLVSAAPIRMRAASPLPVAA